MNSFQPNNFQPGIGAQSGFGGGQIQGSAYGSLLPMLQQLLEKRLGNNRIGTNGVLAPGGDQMNGYYDTFGNFKTGLPSS